MLISLMIVAGFLGGFIGAQVGSGAMITLPALLFLGMPPVLAIGSNMLSAWLINVVAFLKYFKSGKIIIKSQTASFAVVAFVGSLIGANLLLMIDKSLLSKIVAVFFISLIFLIFKKPAKLDNPNPEIKQKYIDIAAILAFLVGIYGGFFTVAVTTFFIFILVYLLKRKFLEASAESVFIVSIVLLVALLVFIKNGNIDWRYSVPLALSSIVGSWVGAATALKFGDKWIKGLLIFTIVVVILKLIFKF
jgi:uncharacterized membrane protein YfcA